MPDQFSTGNPPDSQQSNENASCGHLIFLHVFAVDAPRFDLNALVLLIITGAITAALKREDLYYSGGGGSRNSSLQFIYQVKRLNPALELIKQVIFDLHLEAITEIAYQDDREMIVRPYYSTSPGSVIAEWPLLESLKPGPLENE